MANGDPAADGLALELVVAGLNRRTAGAALCDKLFAEGADTGGWLDDIAGSGVTQAIAVLTCDRCEVIALAPGAPAASAAVFETVARRAGVAPTAARAEGMVLAGEAALRHVFAVAASLESSVVGEAQILGQIREAHRLAAERGMLGPDLEAVMQAAYAVAKRVRGETGLGDQPISLATAAVQVARRVHGDLGRCAGLFLGVGEMAEVIAERLAAAGLRRLTVAHPREQRAALTARHLDAHFMTLDQALPRLAQADIVLCGLGSGGVVLEADAVERALKARRRRPMLVIDAAVPADSDAGIDRLNDAFRYDLDDLERLAMAGRSDRTAAAAQARRLVDEAVAEFLRARAERLATPAVTAIRRRFEAVRDAAIAEGGDPSTVAHRIVQRLLHEPSVALRALAAEGRAGDMAAAEGLLRRLFAIDDPTAPDGDATKE